MRLWITLTTHVLCNCWGNWSAYRVLTLWSSVFCNFQMSAVHSRDPSQGSFFFPLVMSFFSFISLIVFHLRSSDRSPFLSPCTQCMPAKSLRLYWALCDPVECGPQALLSMGVCSKDTGVRCCALRASPRPRWYSGKNLPANAGDAGSIPGSGRPAGEGNGSPLQYSCLANPMDGGDWWATAYGVTKSQT